MRIQNLSMAHPLHAPRYQLIAKLLTKLRGERQMRQQDVADRLDRPQAFVSKYESGVRRLDLVELLDVLAALEVDPHDFIDQYLAQQSLTALPR